MIRVRVRVRVCLQLFAAVSVSTLVSSTLQMHSTEAGRVTNT